MKNTPDGVVIHIEGAADRLPAFRDRLEHQLPPAAEIHALTVENAEAEDLARFSIRTSERIDDAIGRTAAQPIRVVITPDLSVCPTCLGEFGSDDDRRHGFALSGCTDCGPRFSIQTAAPFDRERTTMVDFPPCPDCLNEYADPSDRRFHAQNIACPRCGPRIRLEMRGDLIAIVDRTYPGAGCTDLPVIEEASRLLQNGKILAVKGVGRIPPDLRRDIGMGRPHPSSAQTP